MTSDLYALWCSVEYYSDVTVFFKDDRDRTVSIRCYPGQEITMVGYSAIVASWAVREYGCIRTRLTTIRPEKVLMVVAECPIYGLARRKTCVVRGSDGRFEPVQMAA